METDTIVIVGGYGQVGREVGRRLAPLFPGRVVIAGRSLPRAQALATGLGNGTRALRFDVATAPPPPGACLVITCIDQVGAGFVERCLRAGIDYVDVTAKEDSLRAFEQLSPLARSSGATAILSVGVSPGLTNVLAAHAATQLDEVSRVDLFLLLGMGDRHGEAALGWTLDSLDAVFDVHELGHARRVQSFGESIRVRLPQERWARSGFRFNFPDQRVVARTLGIPTVSTWLLLDSRWMTWLAWLAVRCGLARALRRPLLRRLALGILGTVHIGSDACVAMVRATGRAGAEPATREFAVTGRQEAVLTGTVAAEVARELLSGHRPGGVLHLEQFVSPREFLGRLSVALPGTRVWL